MSRYFESVKKSGIGDQYRLRTSAQTVRRPWDSPRSTPDLLTLSLGRTGRRPGALRNCLFLATNDNALLRAGAIIALWETGFVEPVVPPKHPLHLFAQQLMALALQEQGIGVRDWRRWIARLPPFFDIPDSDVDALIHHLLEQKILFSDGARLSFGERGEDLYGRRHFLDLVSVFTSPPLFTVLHGRNELGTVHEIAFLRHRGEQPTVLSLGGRSWTVTSLDWGKRLAYAVPSEEKGKSQWLSTQFGLSSVVCRAMHDLLSDNRVSPRWSSRAKEKIASLRTDYEFLDRSSSVALVVQEANEIRWFTFFGTVVNLALADAIRVRGYDGVKVSDFLIRVSGTTDHLRFFDTIESLTAEIVRGCFKVPSEYLTNLKFSECLPQRYAETIIKERLLPLNTLRSVLTERRKVVIC